ncbi:MAG TPA: ATP-dependent DNA helicase [Acidimicrobiales bacterium]|nr:ATP-dependent DNA helicase [Acidimicrobiales bacterium]
MGDIAAALAEVTRALPGAEVRPGQIKMAEAVEHAITTGRHLVVQAGTGTGKTLAYLVPAILSGQRVVVATATKALQDQLVGKDLPFLATHLDRPFSYASLKGRSNYLCLQRAKEILGGDPNDQNDKGEQQIMVGVDPLADRAPRSELLRLIEWATESPTGERAELTFEPSTNAWTALSVSARECPGVTRCAIGEACFAERARAQAADADVIVVNTHLYGMHLATGGAVLPEHDLVVFDEAHQLEEVISATAGIELTGGSFVALARAVKALIADERLIADLEAMSGQLNDALMPHHGRRIRGLDDVLAAAVEVGQGRVDRALAAVRAVNSDAGDTANRKQRAIKAATALSAELATVRAVPETDVSWVEGPRHAPRLRIAPIDVAPTLEVLWGGVTAVLTSATIPSNLPIRLGLPAGEHDQIDVGSPFDYGANALLYCAAHLPDPRAEGYDAAIHDELEALITAAGGRTLALFTSWRAMQSAVDALRERLPFPVLDQQSLPKPALVKAFTDDPSACLFATMGFWQGVDVVGSTLSLVTIDKLPFPRPDEPLLQARRERARQGAFALVDLPRATTLLAQGAGRLIRSATDRGVVAVFDPRLATARYRWEVVNALPPMRRTRERSEVEAFLRDIRDQ